LLCKETYNRELDPFSSECKCKPGYKEALHDGKLECVPCYTYKHVCVEICPKNTILNEQTNSCQDINYQIQNNTTILIICAALIIIA